MVEMEGATCNVSFSDAERNSPWNQHHSISTATKRPQLSSSKSDLASNMTHGPHLLLHS